MFHSVTSLLKRSLKWMPLLLLGLGLFLEAAPGTVGSAKEKDLGTLSNEELLARAERTFLMRNFLAAERYYRELTDRLTKRLSSLEADGLQRQIEIEEELIIAPFGMGHSLIYLHRYSEAQRAIEKGLKIYPEWASNHVPLLFFQDPLFTGPVLSDLETRMKLSSDQAPWLIYGYIQFLSENRQTALDCFSRVLGLESENFLADYFVKHIHRAGEGNALPSPEGFNDKDSDKLPVEELINYGSSFFKSSNYTMAAKLFKRAIEKKQDTPVVHIAYGDSLFALGKFDEATLAILEGLRVYPKYAERRINRRDFYGNPSEFDLQLQQLENYVRENPDDLNAKFLLGYNYFFTQDYAKADELFRAVLSNKTLQASAQYFHDLIQKFGSQNFPKSSFPSN